MCVSNATICIIREATMRSPCNHRRMILCISAQIHHNFVSTQRLLTGYAHQNLFIGTGNTTSTKEKGPQLWWHVQFHVKQSIHVSIARILPKITQVWPYIIMNTSISDILSTLIVVFMPRQYGNSKQKGRIIDTPRLMLCNLLQQINMHITQ